MAKLENVLWGFLIFSLIIVSAVFIIGDVNNNYDVNIDTSDFNDTYNTIDEMYDLTDQQRETVIESEVSGVDATDSTIKDSFNAIRLVKDTFALFGNIINDAATIIGVPSFMITFALTAFTILAISLIIFIFLRLRN